MPLLDKLREQYGVGPLCSELHIAPSTYYHCQQQRHHPDKRSARAQRDDWLKKEIQRVPGHAGHGLVGFQLCGLSVVCGLCRASILAGLAGMQGYASPLRSPGPSFPSAVIFRSFVRSGFAASPCNSRQPCASGCGFPCAPASPPYRPAFMEARHRPVSQNM